MPVSKNKSFSLSETTLIDGFVDMLKTTQRYWKKSLTHAGEKGRASEFIVRDVLEEILPRKYSVGTGFVITTAVDDTGKTKVRSSSQQDIVIFDHHENPARLSRDNFGLFPVEAVYATVEVKERLNPKELRSFFEASRTLTDIAKTLAYIDLERKGGRVTIESSPSTSRPRRYLIAMSGPTHLVSTFKEVQREAGARDISVHGILTLNSPQFVRFGQRTNRYIEETGDAAFITFVRYLLNGIMSKRMDPFYPKKYLTVPAEDDDE